MQQILLICLLWLCQPLFAGEVQRADVIHKKGVYTFHFDAVIEGTFDDVYSVVTDYENLHQLSDSMLTSELLHTSDDGIMRLRFLAKTCLLIFCFEKKLVADAEEISKGVFKATDVSELSDFMLGQGTWSLIPVEERQTRIKFEGLVEPDFWIPPIIGPWLIKKKIKKLSLESINKIELIVNDA